jgi:hypothetical protein
VPARELKLGDQPIATAKALSLVFKEVLASTGGKRLPVQLLYSNAVHTRHRRLSATFSPSLTD